MLAILALPGLVESVPAQTTTPSVRFHHVHLNVTNPAATLASYQKFLGATTVKYRGLSDALFTKKSFILLSKVAAAPPTNVGTTLWHIGWAGVDGGSEFARRTKEGIAVQTPITPLGPNHYMYFWANRGHGNRPRGVFS